MRWRAAVCLSMFLVAGCVEAEQGAGPERNGTGGPSTDDGHSGAKTPGCDTRRERPTGTQGPHGAYESDDWSRENLTYSLDGDAFEVRLPLPVSPGAGPSTWAAVLEATGDVAWNVTDALAVAGTGPATIDGCLVRSAGACCAEDYMDRQWLPEGNTTVVEVLHGQVAIQASYTARSHHCGGSDAWDLTADPGRHAFHVDTGSWCS